MITKATLMLEGFECTLVIRPVAPMARGTTERTLLPPPVVDALLPEPELIKLNAMEAQLVAAPCCLTSRALATAMCCDDDACQVH